MMARGGLGVVILLASLSSLHGMRGPPAAAARQRAVRMMADAAPRRANAIPIIEEIVELAGNDYVNKAVRMLQSMDKQRAQLQGIPRKEAGRAYAAVWDASARTSRYAITLNIYQRLLAEPGLLELDDAKVDTVLLACERQADGVLAEQIMRQVGESAKRYNRVIRARTKQLEITDAVRLYRELQQRKWKLETSTINLMMQVCFAIKQVDYSLKLFQAMDALGLEADERTFTIAIRSAAASKVAKGPRTATDIGSGWVLSLRLLNAMRAKEQAQGMPRIKQAPLVPSAYCFSTVIRTLAFAGARPRRAIGAPGRARARARPRPPASRAPSAPPLPPPRGAGEADKAVSVLGQMVKAERSPDAGLYAVVMKACGLRGRIDEASALLDEMVAAGLSADVAHVAALMLGCERRGDSRRALAILDKLPSLGLKPTTLTYNMAMASCAKRGEIKEAEGLLAQMDAAGEEGRPDIVSLNTMLDTYKRADQWEACLEFLLKMEVRSGEAAGEGAAPRPASGALTSRARARRPCPLTEGAAGAAGRGEREYCDQGLQGQRPDRARAPALRRDERARARARLGLVHRDSRRVRQGGRLGARARRLWRGQDVCGGAQHVHVERDRGRGRRLRPVGGGAAADQGDARLRDRARHCHLHDRHDHVLAQGGVAGRALPRGRARGDRARAEQTAHQPGAESEPGALRQGAEGGQRLSARRTGQARRAAMPARPLGATRARAARGAHSRPNIAERGCAAATRRAARPPLDRPLQMTLSC